MPKKPPRNAFYFYMIDFKEEQRKKGIHYANMAEVADAAGPLWRDAPPPVRSKFETIAKKEKEKFNVPQHKYTSNGISYAEIDQQMREQQEAIKYERNDIKNMVTCKGLGYSVNLLDIYVIDVNSYCKVNTGYLIGECTLLRFNLQEGYKEYYHEVINPVHIPVGYVSDVKAGCQELGLDMPDESKPTAPLPSVLANIVDYLKQSDPESNILPPMFTLPEKVAPVMDFIHQLCRRAGEDETLFRVYQLDTLFFTLANAFKTRPDEGFPKESLARDKLKRDPFKYTPDLGCEHHENDEREKSVECTLSRVKRWAFTVLDTCCPIAGIDMVPGKHVPVDFDLVKIHEFQEQKKIRTAPSVAQVMAASAASRNTTLSPYTTRSADSSVSTSTEVAVEAVKKEKRVHVPLRQPKTDYSERLAAPPELCSTEFPSLPVRGSRGRGMSSGINRLKLDE